MSTVTDDGRRCAYCERRLIGKRSQAQFCDDLCGRAYRAAQVHMSNEAQEFWKGVRRVSGGRRIPWKAARGP